MNLHLSELEKIPDIHAKALHYVFENNLISDRRDYSPANNISPPWENVALRIRRNPLFEERNKS